MILLISTLFSESVESQNKKYRTLIVNGQNNHNWEIGSMAMEKILLGSGLFTVDIITSPEKGADMSNFKPSFNDYDLIVLDYNGDEWCNETKTSFVNYVKKGGGVFILHAANNSFPDWKEYNEIIGLGGWKGRNEEHGPYIFVDEKGKTIRDNSPGKGGAHGVQHEYIVKTQLPKHPIMKGLPNEWLHAQDELYHGLRGPAKNLTILATAYSDPKTKGNNKFLPTGRNEPALMTIKYGKGRIVHTIFGHASLNKQAMKCAGFIVTSLRGAEWAASGKVKQKIPKNLPTKETIRLWEEYKEP